MRFDQPVGSEAERAAATAWGGAWFDASGFGRASAAYKASTGDWHTGADLNLPNWADSRKQVFASADGVAVFVGTAAGWQGRMVVLRHAGGIWTRYAHLAEARVVAGQSVKRGDWLAIIGDYAPAGGANDHLHFDVARIDLGASPGDWPGADLARLERDYVDPLEWINAHRIEVLPPMAITKWTPTSADGTRVRLTPDTSSTANIAGVIPPASIVDGDLSADGKWLQVQIKPERMTVSDVALAPSVAATFAGFAAAQYMKPAPITHQPPPQPPPAIVTSAAMLLGVHELSGQGRAKRALELGAKAVMCFEDALGAAQLSLAYPDAIVMHRKDFRYPLPARDLVAAHGINPDQVSNSRAWYRGANENDVATWDSDVESIRRRAAFDVECATLLKRAAPNAKWVAGGFAHGNPDFTDARICDVMREVYAPAYNAGLITFDIHTYSKCDPGNPKNYRFYAPIWFERRWELLFTKCGFDPNVRAIVSSETGGECGQGGFNWAGFTPDEFRAWCAYFMKVSQQSLVIGGVSYPSPMLAATLFQWGNTYGGSGGWLGYALDNYIGVLQSAWAGQVPAEKALEADDEIALYAGEIPPSDYAPAAKDFSL